MTGAILPLKALRYAAVVSTLLTGGVCRGDDAPLVAIDVGHGLVAQGASSARGRGEFEFNRSLARILGDTLRQRAWPVRDINADGEIGGLVERPLAAVGARFFLSIHHDSIGEAWLKSWDWDGVEQTYTDVKQGFGLFISERNPQPELSLRCARDLGRALRAAGFAPSTWHARKHQAADADNGVWYYNNLVVLHRTTLPAVLFEAGVIKHREEELALQDPVRQGRMATALANGLSDCLAPVTQASKE